jgi:hypothetical protein
MIISDRSRESLVADELLRRISNKMSEQLLLIVSIRGSKDTDILRGVSPVSVPFGTTIHIIADPRLFRVKFVFAKNAENILEKHALIKHNCHRFIISFGQMTNCWTNGDLDRLAQDIVREITDLLQAISQIDLQKKTE